MPRRPGNGAGGGAPAPARPAPHQNNARQEEGAAHSLRGWGGAHPRVLPAGLRVAGVVSILIYAVMAALALDRAGAVALLVAVG